MNNPANLTCPKCGQKDQIQKVSGLYEANTKEWTERHGTGSSRHTTFHRARTLLGEKLAPPAKPAAPTNPLWIYGIIAVVVVFLLSILCPTACSLLAVPLMMLAPALFDPGVAGQLAELNLPSWTLYVGLACGGALLLALLVGLVWGGVALKRRYDRDMEAYRGKLARYNQDELPRWQSTMERWDRLYYCARDETVFFPGDNRAIPADQMRDYL